MISLCNNGWRRSVGQIIHFIQTLLRWFYFKINSLKKIFYCMATFLSRQFIYLSNNTVTNLVWCTRWFVMGNNNCRHSRTVKILVTPKEVIIGIKQWFSKWSRWTLRGPRVTQLGSTSLYPIFTFFSFWKYCR